MYKRDYAAAIEDFSEAIQIDANNAMAYANRGYAWSVQNSFDKAVSDFTEVIRLEPNDAYAFEGRGFAWAKIGVFDKSLADCTETIRLSPSKSSAYVSRGYAWTMMGEFENSIDDFTEAIRLDPIDASAYVSRGYSWWKAGNNAAALQDYGEAIRLNAEDASAYNNFAWLVSTCPIAEFRDGSKGLDYATKACELSNWETWYNIGTLAAAYAEIEQWENAVKWQKLAITLATDEKDKQGGRDRLELYKSRKPYREQPATVKDIALFK